MALLISTVVKNDDNQPIGHSSTVTHSVTAVILVLLDPISSILKRAGQMQEG